MLYISRQNKDDKFRTKYRDRRKKNAHKYLKSMIKSTESKNNKGIVNCTYLMVEANRD